MPIIIASSLDLTATLCIEAGTAVLPISRGRRLRSGKSHSFHKVSLQLVNEESELKPGSCQSTLDQESVNMLDTSPPQPSFTLESASLLPGKGRLP